MFLLSIIGVCVGHARTATVRLLKLGAGAELGSISPLPGVLHVTYYSLCQMALLEYEQSLSGCLQERHKQQADTCG